MLLENNNTTFIFPFVKLLNMIIRKDIPSKKALLHDSNFCNAKQIMEQDFTCDKKARTFESHYEVDAKTEKVYWYVEVGY